jgi:hypothetical protein
MEDHNLGEMAGVTPSRVGLPKVEALVQNLRRFGTADLDLELLDEPAWSPTVVGVVKRCDVVFVAADHDAARLTATILSTLYHKVHLDCATGISFPMPATPPPSAVRPIPARIMGADVRLILPGDGCLLYRGNLREGIQRRGGDALSPAIGGSGSRQLDGAAGRFASFLEFNGCRVCDPAFRRPCG